MDAIERAIRQAFEKGDAGDRAFREKVYRSAFAALERSLGARADLSEQAGMARRDRLKATITAIETEFLPARRAPAPQPGPEPQREPGAAPARAEGAAAAPPGTAPTTDFAPRVERDDRRTEPRSGRAGAESRRAPRRGRSLAMLFLLVTLVAFVAIGAWWSLSSGIFLSAAQRDTGVPNPPLQLSEEQYPAGGEHAADRWLTVFSPADPTTVAAPGSASAEVLTDDDSAYIRLAGSADTAIVFDVGRGILETLAGRRAMFSIRARARDNDQTQMSVSCRFGALGDCDRKRYVVGPTASDFLFEVTLPEGDPGSGGTIAIVPDVEGRGRTLDVFSIRAAAAR